MKKAAKKIYRLYRLSAKLNLYMNSCIPEKECIKGALFEMKKIIDHILETDFK